MGRLLAVLCLLISFSAIAGMDQPWQDEEFSSETNEEALVLLVVAGIGIYLWGKR